MSRADNNGMWEPGALAGITPYEMETPERTPILDRFLRNPGSSRKETYLPTLQALPGK
eukprot:CAMPEP_0195508736 /NCGR_PEP_ID=MMETSP0794_2-20130614/1869_1 /TAXON_ID=515487 /ORGANISM="Stephanopyxis turris, Strain CCMP 815" /LENGTH=57 /DNA_ID=CAMNT_0040635775 /DNA_START=33 /DNA_END=203 /DNA_ORIENTATION=+